MELLKDHLLKNPHLKNVYFNDKGEWQFFPRKDFPIVKTREEVLGDESGSSSEDGSNSKTTVKAADLIALINAAVTSDEVDKLVEGEKRSTVLAAADAKKKSFEE